MSNILSSFDSKTKECKGMRYRYTKTVYIGKRGDVNEKISLTPLKRQSCKGDCDRPKSHLCDADWMLGYLTDELSEFGMPNIPSDAQNQSVFQLCAKVFGGSYEYLDDVDVELYFKEVCELEEKEQSDE